MNDIESKDSQTATLPVVSGILLIVEGAFKILSFLGAIITGLFAYLSPWGYGMPHANISALLVVGAIVLLIVGTFSVIAGIYSVKREKWGVALAGSIVATPFSILGIAALIMIILSRKDFKS